MNLAKYLILFGILVIGIYAGSWYYIMDKQVSYLNNKFADKKMLIKNKEGIEYYVTFNKVKSNGFPFKWGIEIVGWQEESRSAEIVYPESIFAGYDLFSQRLYTYYNGKITATYKPVKNNFGSRLEVNNYLVTIELPLTSQLIDTIKNFKDPIQVINHIGEIHISSDEVKAYDLQNNEKFYDKSFEELELTFKPRKYYISYKDFIENIPSVYHVNYKAKTNLIPVSTRHIPASLFYIFFKLPNDFQVVASVDLTTAANNLKDIGQDIDLKLNANFTAAFLDLKAYNLSYVAQKDHTQSAEKKLGNFKVDSNAKIYLKKGAFNELFNMYEMIKPKLINSSEGKVVNREIEYIIKNKEEFKFAELENSEYDFILKANGANNKHNMQINLEDLSAFSEKSGIKLTQESTIYQGNPKKWIAKGILLLRNYPAIIEFSSGYIYRFGKFRGIDDIVRKIYINVNKKFLKKISDYPSSTSNDLSFSYEISSDNLSQAKIGNIRVEQFLAIYEVELFKELLAYVGPGEDIINRMKKIIPDLDENSEIIKQILPGIEKLDNLKLNKKLPSKLQEAIPLKEIAPKETNDLINKVIQNNGNKEINKDLLKNLLQ